MPPLEGPEPWFEGAVQTPFRQRPDKHWSSKPQSDPLMAEPRLAVQTPFKQRPDWHCESKPQSDPLIAEPCGVGAAATRAVKVTIVEDGD